MYKSFFTFVFLILVCVQTPVFSKLKNEKTSSNNATIIQNLLNSLPFQESSEKPVSKKILQDRILDIKIVGNNHVSKEDILSELSIAIGDPIDLYKINRSIKNIQSLSLFSSVTYDIKKSRKRKGSILTLYLTENPLIEEIVFLGNTQFKPSVLEEKILSKKGAVFKLDDVRKDMKEIEALYHEAGFAWAKIYKIEPPTEDHPVLFFHIGEGVLEELSITGNLKTKDYVIIRELELRPGDVLKTDLLQKDVRRVFNLNYFEAIDPQLTPILTTANAYRLELALTEKKTSGSFSFGGGYSPLSGFSVMSNLYWDNVFGTGQLVMINGSLSLGSGGQARGANNYQIKYHNPWMWDKRKYFTARTWLTDGQVVSFLGGGGVNYSPQKRNGFDIEVGFPQANETFWITHKTKFESVLLLNENVRAYNIYSYTLGLIYDTRDYNMNPTKGFHHVFTAEKSLTLSPISLDFFKSDLTLRQYIPTFKKQVLALRTTLGSLSSPQINDMQLYATERYYVGGGSTVRGYDDYNPFAQGVLSLVSGIEYRFLFTDIFQLILFADLGSAANNLNDLYSFSKHKLGKGVGVRLNVPGLGPLRLDLGFDDNQNSRVHFNIGHTF